MAARFDKWDCALCACSSRRRSLLVLCESFVRRKSQKICYERCKKLLKEFQKSHTIEFHLPMKRFSIFRRNSIAKMITYMPKVVTRPETNSQGFRVVGTPLPHPIGNCLGKLRTPVQPRFISVTPASK